MNVKYLGKMVKLTVSMFKEDAKRNLGHMQEFIHLSEPSFQHQQGTKEGSTSKSNDEEVEFVMRYYQSSSLPLL